MPTIIPSSDLKNNYNEISEMCHKYHEPIFITKNGKGDLGVMSVEAYERLNSRFELHTLINEGLRDVAENKVYSFDETMAEIKEALKI